MLITNSTMDDIDEIFALYEAGTSYQKKVAMKHWKGLERSLVESEIRDKRQWKIIIDGAIACIFAVSYNDPIIWQERDQEPSIYLHRIVTNPLFRGNGFVKFIVSWAKQLAINTNKIYIRMDTGSGNEKLNNYYVNCGFNYLGVVEYPVSDDLPEHYRAGSSSLFEIAVQG